MNLSKFGENVKGLLNERDMTAKQLAKKIGVAAPTITRYINGERMPDINILVLIADYFNCSTDYLFDKEPDNQNLKFKKCPPFTEQIAILARHFSPTFEEFYENAKISKTAFFDWKNGNRLPTLESIFKIADTYECRLDFVLGRES